MGGAAGPTVSNSIVSHADELLDICKAAEPTDSTTCWEPATSEKKVGFGRDGDPEGTEY